MATKHTPWNGSWLIDAPGPRFNEYAAVLQASRKSKTVSPGEHAKTMQEQNKIAKMPFIVISLFILIWLAGILADEPRQVLSQAIRICLSCIGIG